MRKLIFPSLSSLSLSGTPCTLFLSLTWTSPSFPFAFLAQFHWILYFSSFSFYILESPLRAGCCCCCCRVISVFLLPFIDVSLLLRACYCSPALRLVFVFPFFFLFCVFLCASIQLTAAWWRRHAPTPAGVIVVVHHITTLGQDIRL